MDQYIPPFVAVTTGLCTILLCFFIRIPFFIIGLLSIIVVIYALQDHLYRFANDYRNFSAPDFFKQHASILIVSLVILLSLGFLLFKFGSRAVSQNEPTSNYGSVLGSWFEKRHNSTNKNASNEYTLGLSRI
jgi:hypothetical protein